MGVHPKLRMQAEQGLGVAKAWCVPGLVNSLVWVMDPKGVHS